MTIPLSHDALWTSYEDVRLLVHKMVGKFIAYYGGDFAELQSEAEQLFIKAHHAYDPSRAKYITWIGRNVWWGLLETQREFCRRAKYSRQMGDRDTPGLRIENIHDEQGFDLGAFLGGLSADARTVARLAIEAEQRDCRNRRRAVLNFLWDCKWTAERIAESFGELREALS